MILSAEHLSRIQHAYPNLIPYNFSSCLVNLDRDERYKDNNMISHAFIAQPRSSEHILITRRDRISPVLAITALGDTGANR